MPLRIWLASPPHAPEGVIPVGAHWETATVKYWPLREAWLSQRTCIVMHKGQSWRRGLGRSRRQIQRQPATQVMHRHQISNGAGAKFMFFITSMFVVLPFTLYYLKPIQASLWLTFWCPHKGEGPPLTAKHSRPFSNFGSWIISKIYTQ